jgi:hypothetical protein
VHAWVFVSQAIPIGQSLDVWHPHAPPFDVYAHALAPAGFVLQSVHAAPSSPHAVFDVPPWQVPVAPQHPPLHGCVGEHALVHLCVARSHARNVPQSAAVLHPHAPAAVHADPSGDLEQSVHVPDAPHALASLPPWHTPAGEQQPAAHACVAQLLPQRRVTGSQTSPAGQSAVVEQPHAPSTHAWPCADERQSTHAEPPFPHAAADGSLHAPAAQQPLLHVDAEHAAPASAGSGPGPSPSPSPSVGEASVVLAVAPPSLVLQPGAKANVKEARKRARARGIRDRMRTRSDRSRRTPSRSIRG